MPRGHPGQVKKTTKNLGNHGNLPGPGPGRPKGVPNKVNRDLKEAYLMAANLAGGKEGLIGYLKKQAELENPSAFMTGLSKLLPSMLEGNPDAPLIVERVYYTRDGGLKPICLACCQKPCCSIRRLLFTRANPASIETWRLDAPIAAHGWQRRGRVRPQSRVRRPRARKNRRCPWQVLSRGPA